MERTCVICGKKLEITVNVDKTYSGGHYFGELTIDEEEYWECNECYEEGDDEDESD